MKKLWKLSKVSDPEIVNNLARDLSVSDMVAELLVKRDIHTFKEAKLFFRPQLEDLINPFLMKDMDNATNKIKQSIKNNEKIMVYGDYDVDGTTSVALMYSYLIKQKANVIYYIPDRYKEGYGLSLDGVEKAKEEKVSLIIIIDCGIKAIKQIEIANKYKIDTIICDHHKPGKILPNAKAILNPKQRGCDYPYKHLCGCGIGFKLIQAMEIQKEQNLNFILEYLDLVAIAICADIVPMTGENRVLTFLGLQLINKNIRPGLYPFFKEKKNKIDVSDLIFTIAPRINAAGRMKHGKYAVELLICKEENQIYSKARAIEILNSERKLLDKKTTKEAIDQVETLSESKKAATVVFRPDWHKGVIGIVASRLIEQYYRPTVVLTKSGDNYSGSVRSVRGFDIYEVLLSCADHMIQFGGHKYAAGLTLSPYKYSDFKRAFEKEVLNIITHDQKTPSIIYDIETTLDNFDFSLFRIINQMSPFGPNNSKPIFLIKNCKDNGFSKLVGAEKNHLSFGIKDEKETNFYGIGFEMGEHISRIKMMERFSILVQLQENKYNGKSKLQLLVKDIYFE